MPAFARGPPPDASTWHNDARYAASSGPNHPQPPTGPSRGMPPQRPAAMMQQQQQVSAPAAPTVVVSAATPIPEPPAIPTFSHIPYFTAIQLETLYARRRGARMSASTWQTNRDIATGFIQSVASRLGFPQRAIATAQQIYQRFHLFYPPSDFVLHEIAVASLFVAAKLNDTHKKPRDLLLASYALRYPQLVRGSSDAAAAAAAAPPSASQATSAVEEHSFPTLAGQKRKHAAAAAVGSDSSSSPRPLAMAIGSVGEADIDPNILETDRKRLMALEKLILESLCFNFHSNANMALKMVIKLGRRSGLSKSFIRTAWKFAGDMFRTSAPMQYPPNVIAVASLYGAALLARPPPRTSTSSRRETDSNEKETGAEEGDDALVAFLRRIYSVSASPAPYGDSASSAEAGSSQIPLCEPFPGCDPESRVHVEDVEEAVHELLDLYLACTAQLPPSLYMSSASGLGPSHGHSGSAAATPSPLSPADPLDLFNASPSSSGGSDSIQPSLNARKKLKQYEYSPPPFGLVDWLNSARCTQLQQQEQQLDRSAPSVSAPAPASSAAASLDPTLPTKELSALLTDLKIYLRGIEYDRQRADDAFLAQLNLLAEVDVVPLLSPETGSEMLASAGAGGAISSSGVATPANGATPGVGILGMAVRSVSIVLHALSGSHHDGGGGDASTGDELRMTSDRRGGDSDANKQHDGGDGVGLSKLEEGQRKVVERIQRRKLANALRLTFVEPEIEKQRPTSHPSASNLQYQQRKQEARDANTAINASDGSSMPSTKRNRIDIAKRYLF